MPTQVWDRASIFERAKTQASFQTGQPSQTESALQYPILKFVICFAAPATISNASSGILKKRISSSVSSSPIEVFFTALNPHDFAVTEIGRVATCKHHDPMLNLRRCCQNLMRLQGTAIAPRGMPEGVVGSRDCAGASRKETTTNGAIFSGSA
jgi:hypothetical protein